MITHSPEPRTFPMLEGLLKGGCSLACQQGQPQYENIRYAVTRMRGLEAALEEVLEEITGYAVSHPKMVRIIRTALANAGPE